MSDALDGIAPEDTVRCSEFLPSQRVGALRKLGKSCVEEFEG